MIKIEEKGDRLAHNFQWRRVKRVECKWRDFGLEILLFLPSSVNPSAAIIF
ncbi:hypothetical protein QUB80_04820 [Chlorogloeopsis sp. ULAP01]|uniref:hypothetical protein n=1 Tax=Chlorogloeopsis sp. ULAP01 TaxID=3056483 RepID=UPI0025AA40BC|nr:hypothetical protein [Chlorogloeopsis sp. ULAP01]MDM9380022.1 hypothetical protein [Chlorogloeopsis sp. ULAP01]